MCKEDGVTLVELLIVIAILSVLAMVAIPSFVGQGQKASRTEAYANLQNLRLLEEQYFAENGRYAPNPNSTWNYNGTPGAADSGIEDVLPGFRPGDVNSLKFTYSLQSSGATGNAFTATATGKAGTRVTAEVYTINQDNVRTGW